MESSHTSDCKVSEKSCKLRVGMKKQTIGIIGGGQLGQMLTLAAKKLGFDVIVVDTKPHSPAAQVGAKEIVSKNYDAASLRKLAERADFLTTEFEEGLDIETLKSLKELGKPIYPKPETIELVQDKFEQKKMMTENGVPSGDFGNIEKIEDAHRLLKEYGGKMVIKTRRGGYDGKGNIVVKSEVDNTKAFMEFGNQDLYAEKFVDFTKELAIMVAIGSSGEVAIYPVVETVQERNICLEVIAPADITEEQANQAREIAYKVVRLLDSPGIFGIELFLTKDGNILLNEIAPRVHNSGHYTIEACSTSQFEQHIRAITGMELGSTEMLVSSAVMINILGEHEGKPAIENAERSTIQGHTTVHMYGKSDIKVDRKMGHLTTTAESREEALEQAHAARKEINV